MPDPAAPLHRIGTLWDFGDPAGSEARFRDLLPAARASGDGAYLCELLTQIARAQGLQQGFEEAFRTLDEAEAMLRPEWARARVYCLLERGRVLNSSLHKAEARTLFLKAWEEATATAQEAQAVDAAHMVAIAGTPEQSFEWNGRAIAFAERSTDPAVRGWLGSIYNNAAWDLHKAGRFEEALALFEKVVPFREERKQAADVSIARWCVARCLRSLGRTGEALSIQQALLGDSEARTEPDGFVLEEMGECLLALGRADEARPHLRRAHGILSKDIWLARDEPARLERLRRIGEGGFP